MQRRWRKDGNIVPVVIVESHQHCLEHIHCVLRQRARLHWKATGTSHPPSLRLVHFDSHPDLACPAEHVPAGACFQPRKLWSSSRHQSKNSSSCRNLYEYLDLDRSGIAQWILPLVLSGDIDRVHWIRNRWSNQIADGSYLYRVGAWLPTSAEDNSNVDVTFESFLDLPEAAVVKVDFQHPYYMEDNSVVPTKELLAPKELNLNVTRDTSDFITKKRGNNNDDWILDICLDYFLCQNPFLIELQESKRRFADALLKSVQEATLLRSSQNYQRDYELFQKQLTKFLNSLLDTPTKCSGECATQRVDQNLEISELRKFYPENRGQILLQELLDTVHCENKVSDEATNGTAKLVRLAVDALPSLELPNDDYENSDIALLEAGRQIESIFNALRSSPNNRPVVITISRSSEDGFTPKHSVEILQSRVVEMLHSVYCDDNCACGDNDKQNHCCESEEDDFACNIDLLFDYGEHEGSSL